MEVGSRIHHFIVRRVRELPEIKARFWEMEHEKNGAELVWLERADENKTFSIAFKTIPENDTGVFHILEHSVLCGSDKYPVKEPFVELVKSSVQTFLNAMTYPDKTVYPVSSRNDKDFLNLIGVYMDAVLRPAIYRKPEIFRQEGWRYEQKEGEAPVYQGVVFNEMKGSMAQPFSILYQELGALLFPDNCYRFNSGGDPAHIPDLSYEEFIANHRKYYHPSNARISLVGSVDLDPVLALIDSYLNDYERLAVDFTIPMQRPIGRTERICRYEIGPEEPEDERAIVAGAVLAARFDETKKIFAADVLAEYLAGDNEAPLKRAILDAGLGQEVKVLMEAGLQQAMFGWIVFNTAADKAPEIRRTVRGTIDRILSEGLDRARLEACFNRYAFDKRDWDGRGWPRSLDEALSMLDSWLYGGDPAQPLLFEDVLDELAAELDGDYFPALLRELFPAEAGELLLVPSKTLGEERRAAEAARVAAESAAWTEEKKAELKAQAEVLAAWQQTPESPEALATIPMLKLSDLDEKPEPLPVRLEETEGTPVLRHALDSELVYARLHFSASDLSLEELPRLALLSRLLGKLGTENYDSAALQTRIKQKIGKLSFAATPLPGSDPAKAGVILSASLSCLKQNLGEARALLEEILLRTRFNDRRALLDVLKQEAMGEQMSLAGRGNRYAVYRAASQATAFGAAREALSGYTFAAWLKERSGDGDEALDALLEKLQALCARVVARERLTLSLSDTALDAAGWAAVAPRSGEAAPGEAAWPTSGAKQEGILIPADVGFAGKASNALRHGRAYNGSVPVLGNILNFEYLWSEIRVQGGAYGCGFGGSEDGDFFFSTFRDPQPGRSLGVFDRASDFIRSFLAGEPELTRFILGAVGEIDPLRSGEEKMNAAESLYFRGRTQEQLNERYRELLHTKSADVLALCAVLDDLAADRQVCVVGGQAQLEACGGALQEILR